MDCVKNQLILLGMLWLKFLWFHESLEVWKDASVNGRVGVQTVEGYRNEDKRSGICAKSA